MPCVGPALESSYEVIGGGQDIDDLAFAFVAPLQSEQDINFLHYSIECVSVIRSLALSRVVYC